MAKNAGKTECLNFILRRLNSMGYFPAVTSVGIDGERKDLVTATSKPEVTIYEGMVFVTSESFFRQSSISAEISEVSSGTTAVGRLLTAKALTTGKTKISGPSEASGVKKLIQRLNNEGIRPVLVDGALSRLSLGAPAVSEAIVLATGAVLSPLPDEIVKKTVWLCSLIDLPQIDSATAKIFSLQSDHPLVVLKNGKPIPILCKTALDIGKHINEIETEADKPSIIFVNGALTDNVLDKISSLEHPENITVLIRDFTCVFTSPVKFSSFLRKGGKCCVMRKPKLLGICVNPVSPEGYKIDSSMICQRIMEATGYEAIDVRKSA